MIFCRMVLPKIFCKIFLSWFPCNEKVSKVFWSQIQKYRVFIARDHCCLIVSFEIPEAAILSVHTCVMGYGWTISSGVFLIIITFLPVMKHTLVSASSMEAATNFKTLKFTCIGPFRRSRTHFESILFKGKYPGAQLHDSGSFRCYALVSACKIMSEA